MKRQQSKNAKPAIIAVTMGDAAGVGPELCLELLTRRKFPGGAIPLVIGSAGVLQHVAKKLKRKFTTPCFEKIPETIEAPAVYEPPGVLNADAVKPAENQARCGRAATRYIEAAVRACLAGRCAAMVTAPISKKALSLAGIDFPGHTEMLAHLTHTPEDAMLLYSDKIACAFVTSHQSLRSVPQSLRVERIVNVTELAHRDVGALKGRAPRLALLGLNPHAGEEGLFGDEETRILLPAKKELARRGIQLEGPLPPDTAFTPRALKRFDCHIALYHDQGCIPFKMLAFDTGVNVTMGLPIIRTSPDHGTAFDIAWQGKVSSTSFMAAFELAVKLAISHQ